MIPSDLLGRYDDIRARFVSMYPEAVVPEFPEGSPNDVVMAIDQMLAALQQRPPTTLTAGDPVIFHDTTPELPAHPAEKKHRADW